MAFKDLARWEGNDNANRMQSFRHVRTYEGFRRAENMQTGQGRNQVSVENIRHTLGLSTTLIGSPLHQRHLSWFVFGGWRKTEGLNEVASQPPSLCHTAFLLNSPSSFSQKLCSFVQILGWTAIQMCAFHFISTLSLQVCFKFVTQQAPALKRYHTSTHWLIRD